MNKLDLAQCLAGGNARPKLREEVEEDPRRDGECQIRKRGKLKDKG